MARRRNKIIVEWLDSKDKGTMNHVNVKHVIGDINKDSVVTVKLNSRHYQAKVVDLLDWKPPKQRRKKSSRAAKKAPKPKTASKRQEKPLFLGNGSPANEEVNSVSLIDSSA